MELRPDRAKIVSLQTRLDAAPVDSMSGPVMCATVEIEYGLEEFSPTISIRLPVSIEGEETQSRRQSRALRSARLLIDHACRAIGGDAYDQAGVQAPKI